jgi:hypothetical protein
MNNQLDKFKADLTEYLKKKDQLFHDLLRVEGIVAYINNEINLLTKDQK